MIKLYTLILYRDGTPAKVIPQSELIEMKDSNNIPSNLLAALTPVLAKDEKEAMFKLHGELISMVGVGRANELIEGSK